MPDAASAHPATGFVLEVGGRFDSEYGTWMAALKAGLALKQRNAGVPVKVYEAAERVPAAQS